MRPNTPNKTRPVGRPSKKSPRAIGPADVLEIGRLYLRGATIGEIAETFGVHHATIGYHIRHSVEPAFNGLMAADLQLELAKIAELERTAWQKIEEPALCSWAAQNIRWAIEQRLKIFGLYAADRPEVNGRNEFRVAGRTPAEVNAEMLEALRSELAKRREMSAAA